jgi:RHS repeat-associated protein
MTATGLDYANNRYYTNAYGRFMTPDPYTNSGRLNDPQSWNRYAYALGDPTNRHDPTGLVAPLVCGGFGDEGEGDASDDCGFIGFNQGCDSGDVMAFGGGPQMPSPCSFTPVFLRRRSRHRSPPATAS